MGYIRWTSNNGSGSTEDTAFIQRVDVRETQIHELWCLYLDNINQEVHPTAQVEVVAVTVGEFTTDYLSKNGRITPIIRKLSINDSVQFLVIPDVVRGSGF